MSQHNPQISVIVPVYNAAQYLAECLQSILSQTFVNFEVILVDDGSTDGSSEICDRFGIEDDRVKVYHQSNGGVTRARAEGVSMAIAPWITFVDADDTLPSDALQELYGKREGTELIIGAIGGYNNDYNLTLDEYRQELAHGPQFHCGPCAKMFLKEHFSTWTFDIPREIVRGEDLIMNMRYSLAMTTAPRFINHIVYNYRQHPDSVMHSTVHTIEHTALFFEHLTKSIPQEFLPQYERALIAARLQGVAHVIDDNPSDTSWQQTTFYQELQADINRTGYKLSLSERIKLMPRGYLSWRISLQFLKLLKLLG